MAPQTPKVPRPSFAIWVGAAFTAVIVLAIINGIGNDEGAVFGSGGLEGRKAPRFAVPALESSLEGDANVDPDEACDVDLPGAIRSCDFRGRPFVLSFWFNADSNCVAVQDELARVADELSGEAGFLSLNVHDDRAEAAETVTEHGWEVPVGYDADGAVFSLYGVASCPAIALIGPDGRIEAEVTDPDIDRAALRRRIKRLTARDEGRP